MNLFWFLFPKFMMRRAIVRAMKKRGAREGVHWHVIRDRILRGKIDLSVRYE